MKTLTEFSSLVLRRAQAARAAKAAEGLEGDALAEALAGELGVATDRASRLIEALDIVGANLDAVRLVRVFQGETGPAGATSVGEFHYAVDRVAKAPSGRRDRRDDRGGGGRDRGGGGGGGGGGRGGGGFGGGDRRDKPRGLGSLKAAASGEKHTSIASEATTIESLLTSASRKTMSELPLITATSGLKSPFKSPETMPW